MARRNIQLIRPNLTHVLDVVAFKIRQYRGVFRNQVNRPAQARWNDDRRAEVTPVCCANRPPTNAVAASE